MTNKFHRAIDHLTKSTDSSVVLGALQAVEELFSAEWLSANEGHRLQTLWFRRDSLSTSELFSLGQAIVRLKKHNSTWLASTASEIKKNIVTSHGLITEIITIGSLSAKGGKINPCPKSFPIYDYTVDFPSGYKYKVSLKNFDISVHEKAFKDRCETIRLTFKNYLKAKNLSGTLQILISEQELTKELTLKICAFIAFQMSGYNNYSLNDLGVTINFQQIMFCDVSGLAKPSDTVMVFAKQHHNEQRNIESKIDTANKKMLSDPVDDTSLKQLIVRLGETTDVDRIKQYLQKIVDDYEQCGFDICLLFQPVVASDPENQSTGIVNTIHHIGKSFSPLSEKLPEKLDNMGLIKMELGVGTMTFTKAPLVLMNGDTQENINLSGFYVYQRGDIYLKMKKDGNSYSSELSRFAPGIIAHAVYEDLAISPVVYAESEKLLIV